MSYILQTVDDDGDEVRVYAWDADSSYPDRLSVTVSSSEGGGTAYVSRSALIAALGVETEEAADADDVECPCETFERVVDTDKVVLLEAARSILDPTGVDRVRADDLALIAGLIARD